MGIACAVYGQIVKSRRVQDAGGVDRALADAVKPLYAEALYGMVLKHQAKAVLEVGMAYGVSSLAVLAAQQATGGSEPATLVSIDPVQTRKYGGIGVLNVARAGHARRHRLIEEPNFLALPRLLRECLDRPDADACGSCPNSGLPAPAARQRFDFAYIDGWHLFDYTMVDIFYCDLMLRSGGVLAFNDCHMRGVHKAIGWLLKYRRYEELDAGLAPDFGRDVFTRAIRGVTRRNSADRYFRKCEDWQPDWDFWAKF